jgi:phenylpropionate dioxygenase-like ring-hydroxylating dioxygenase large terminal subunit
VDRCAHRGAALSKGTTVGDTVACPFHGFQYDAGGHCRLIPANGRASAVPERFRVGSYPTFEKHGLIWIWWGEKPPQGLPEPFFFEDIDASFSSRMIVDAWDTHYSRAIENQLDVIHLPFVHRTTIGRGDRTVVNGPVTEWKTPDHLVVRPFNEVDRGQAPLRPDQIHPPYPPLHVELHLPNLWQNWISDAMRIVVAFVPVDHEHTLLYLRLYQRFLRVPILRGLVNGMVMPFNRVILHQDRRVVVTQTPKASPVGPGDRRLRENLVPGDAPVAAYRMRRQQLIEAAAGAAQEHGPG